VPADPRTGVVADEQRLDELVHRQAREPRGLLPQWQQPCRHRVRRAEARLVEVIAPAEGGGEPLALPPVIAKRRQRRRVDSGNQRLLLAWPNDVICLGKAGQVRLVEQVGLGGQQDTHALEWRSLAAIWAPSAPDEDRNLQRQRRERAAGGA